MDNQFSTMSLWQWSTLETMDNECFEKKETGEEGTVVYSTLGIHPALLILSPCTYIHLVDTYSCSTSKSECMLCAWPMVLIDQVG